LSGYSLKLVGSQHHDLVHRVKQILDELEQPIEAGILAEAFVLLRAELGQLRDQMDAHFLLEATGGYLEEAVARLPRLSPELMQVQRQHAQLLSEVESLMELAGESSISIGAWKHIARQYALFAQQMLDHEAAETRLLQEGFNEDAGAFE